MLKWIAGGAATFLALRYLLRLNRAADTINARTGRCIRWGFRGSG